MRLWERLEGPRKGGITLEMFPSHGSALVLLVVVERSHRISFAIIIGVGKLS